MREEIFEAEDAFESAGSGLSSRGHEPTEAADDCSGEKACDDKRQRLHAGMIGDPDSAGDEDKTGEDAE